MKRFLLLFALLAAVLGASARTYTVDEIPNVQVADSTRLVANPDGILSPEAEARLNTALRNIRSTTSAEPVVVVVDDFDGDDIDSFATDLFGAWGLGKKGRNNGLLILVAKDARRASIRTGYGLEGLLPDIATGKILRGKMFPAFREGDYDGGILAAVDEIQRVLTDPEAAAELRNGTDNEEEDDISFAEFMLYYVIIALGLTLTLLLGLVITIRRGRKKDAFDLYRSLDEMRPAYLAFGVFGLGIPLLAWWALKRQMAAIRNRPRACPNCSAQMHKLDEETDNQYLTPSQDAEERYNSVDYDVWVCPNCRETDILPFPNREVNYTECPACHARTDRLLSNRIVVQPTTSHRGEGAKLYRCLNCHHEHTQRYGIAKLASGAGAPFIGGGGRGFGGGGGGFGGGGFGGGMTGGGGASGGW